MHFVQLRCHCKLHKPRQKHTNQFKITTHTKIHIKITSFFGHYGNVCVFLFRLIKNNNYDGDLEILIA